MAFTVIGACFTSFYPDVSLVRVLQLPSSKMLTTWVMSASKVHVPFFSCPLLLLSMQS